MSYSSNINQVLDDVADKLGHLPLDTITAQVGQYLVASNIERIHEDGKAVDLTMIGQYSTKDILVGKKSFTKESSWDKLYKENTDLTKKRKRAKKALTKSALGNDLEKFAKAKSRFEKVSENNWRTVTVKGKQYHLILLKGGYKQLRALQGKKTNYVNLNYSSKLQSELFLISKNNVADIGFISDYGAKVSQALEEKYNKQIWGISSVDFQEIRNIVIEEITKKLNE